MPPSTLDRPRSRVNPADWVVVVQGRPTVDLPAPAEQTEPADSHARTRPWASWPRLSGIVVTALATVRESAVSRLVLMVGLACLIVTSPALMTGHDPLLALGIKTPHFVAYQGVSADQVRFVMDDGWSQTAAVPGALLMDWREGQAQPALRLTMGNPDAEPVVEAASADGSRINEIRYVGVWPGIDAVIRTMPGGWACNMIVQPGVNPGVIEMEYIGATELTVDRAGRLHVRTANGEWVDGTPESWQDGISGREPVASSYELRGDNRFGFVVGPYDPSRPLVVDPPSERAN
jgi:hypothetical protein